jgi:hypothetical protein
VQRDICIGARSIEQHFVQVPAMDDPIRCTKTLFESPSERGAREHASSSCMPDHKLIGCYDVRLQAWREAKRNEYARGVRRKLNARSGLLRRGRLLVYGRVKAFSRQRECGRQSADACTSNDYRARASQSRFRALFSRPPRRSRRIRAGGPRARPNPDRAERGLSSRGK